MPILSLKKKGSATAAAEAASPAPTPTWTLFDLPGSTSFEIGLDGSESIPTAGGRSNPIDLENAGMLTAGVLHAQINVTYAQASGAAAVTFANGDPDAPYTWLEDFSMRFGGKAGDITAGGRSLHAYAAEAYPGFIDDTTSVALPAANTGTTTIVTPVTHDVYYLVPVAASLDWPAGLVMMANKSVNVTVATTWKDWTSMIAPSNGLTVTVNSASVTWRSLRQSIPLNAAAMPNSMLLYAHTLAEYTKAADKARTQVQLAQGVDGDIMRLGVMVLKANGTRDYTNSLGVTTIKLKKNGADYPIDSNPGTLSFIRNLRARRLANFATPETAVGGDGFDGLAWIPTDVGGGRNWIPAAELASLSVEVIFSSAPPSGTLVAVIVEQLQQLVVQSQQTVTAGTAAVGA